MNAVISLVRRAGSSAGSPRDAIALRFCLYLALVLSGCRQGMYSVRSLPPEFAVPPQADVHALELAQLGGETIRGELIYRGDLLEVKIWGGAEEKEPLKWELPVVEDGTIDIPLVGPVRVAGLSLFDAQRAIRQASISRQVFLHPSVALAVKQRQVHRVTVSGAVKQPGTYELPAASSYLVNALVAAGGLSEQASGVVEIRQPSRANHSDREPPQAGAGPLSDRSSDPARLPATPHGADRPQTFRIDLVSMEASGGGDWYVDDGALILVAEQPRRIIHVLGLVNRPNQYELPHNRDVRVLDALAMAGGTTFTVADKVYVIRQLPDQEASIVIKTSIRQAKRNREANLRLADGDVVSVEETPLTFLVGTIRQFVNLGVGFTAGIPIF